MFAELPKLFDRNFAVGFFLPFALAASAALYLLDFLGLSGDILPALERDLLVRGTIFGLFCWLGGELLLITNCDLYRALEGYGKLNPLRVFTRFELAYYHQLNKEIDKLDNEYYEHLEACTDFPESLKTKRLRLMIERSERFPDRESSDPAHPLWQYLARIRILSKGDVWAGDH